MKKIVTQLSTNLYVLTIVPSLVIIVGLLLSISGNTTAFQRSGAVLVVLAIIAVYINHFFEKEIISTESSLKNSVDLSTKEKSKFFTEDFIEKQNRSVEKKDPNTTYSKIIVDIDGVSEELHSSYQQKKKILPVLKTAKLNAINLEFITGLTGTIIWAFGDYPFI